jgi:hypothetical protein
MIRKSYGQVAYETFCRAAGVDSEDEKNKATWESLDSRLKAQWLAAIHAAISEFLTRSLSMVGKGIDE